MNTRPIPRASAWTALAALLFAGLPGLSGVAAADATAPALVSAGATVAAPRVEVLLDGSRSSAKAATADRAAFIADYLLPATRTVWRFDRAAAKIPTAAGATFASRYSDYAGAMQQVVSPLAGTDPGIVVVLIGDGQESAVTPDLRNPADLAPAGADREQLDQAILKKAETALAPAVAAHNLRFLILDSAAKPGPGGLYPWLVGQRPETQRIALSQLDLGALVSEFARLGWDFGQPWLVGGGVQRCATTLPLQAPEGSPALDLFISAVGDDGAFTVTIDGPDGKPLPPAAADGGGTGLRVLIRDDAGGGRAYTVLGADAGPALTLVTSAPVQVLAVARPHLSHHMQLTPPAVAGDLFAGDPIGITHLWTRAPGATAVSATMAKALGDSASLYFDGRTITPIDAITLPAAAGVGRVDLRLTGPWAARIDTTPLDLTWRVAEPLVLTGGFTASTLVAGQAVHLELTQSGGRKALPAVTAYLTGPGGASRQLDLQAEGGTWKAVVPFSSADLGVWTLDHAAGPAGAESAKLAIAGGRSATVEVTRDWLPIIIIALAVLLAALIASYLIYRMLPRWGGELLERGGARFLFSALPGPKARTTSHGLPALQGKLLFTRKGDGVTLDGFVPGAVVYVNGHQVAPGAVLKPGNDLEVVLPSGERIHARFFASAAEAGGWDHQKAQIDPRSDFDHEHVIIEP